MRGLLVINALAVLVLIAAIAIVTEGLALSELTGWRLVRVDRLEALEAAARGETPFPSGEDDARGEWVIATEGRFPPFNYRDDEGDPAGIEIRIAEEICARLAVSCRFVTAPWEELLPGLRAGEFTLVAASLRIPQEGADGLLYSDAYYRTPGRFAARREALPQAEREAGTLPPLSGARVLVEQGSLHEAFLKRRFPLADPVALPSFEHAWAALEAGEADYLFADAMALSLRLDEADCCEKMGPLYRNPEYFGEGVGFALRGDDRALRLRINHEIEEMRADGTLSELAEPYADPALF